MEPLHRSAAPSVTFDDTIGPSTVSFSVHEHDEPSRARFHQLSAIGEHRWARFRPTAPLAAGTTYSVVVSDRADGRPEGDAGTGIVVVHDHGSAHGDLALFDA